MNRRPRKWSIPQLIEAVKQSDNYTDVIRKLGLGVAGGNAKTIKKYIVQLALDTSHFDPKAGTRVMASLSKENAYSIDEVFIKNSKCSPGVIKRWAKKLIPYECSECDLGNKWNGKQLTLQLDHINGIKSDCRKENLRWVCPNCHTQTSTFAGRKAWASGIIDSTNKCKDCPASISNKSVRCRKCENKRRK